MKNKLISLLLTAGLCLTLCACGNGADSKDQSPAQVNPVVETANQNASSGNVNEENHIVIPEGTPVKDPVIVTPGSEGETKGDLAKKPLV